MKEVFRYVAGAGLMLVSGVTTCAAVAGGMMLVGAPELATALTGIAAGVVAEGAVAYYGIFKEKETQQFRPKVS